MISLLKNLMKTGKEIGMKSFKIIGVKKGKPIEELIDNYDEQVAKRELEEIFDPMNEQHYSRERWDR